MHPQKIELTLPAHLEFSSFLREVSQDLFRHMGFTEEWGSRLKVVLDELFINAVEYGSNQEGRIYVTFLFDEHEVTFHVEDEGKGKHPITPLELKEVVKKNLLELNDIHKEHGRGLALISTLWTDQLQVEKSLHGGLSIGFKKNIIREESFLSSKMTLQALDPSHKAVHLGLKELLNHSKDQERVFQMIENKIQHLGEEKVLFLDCNGLNSLPTLFLKKLSSWHDELRQKDLHLILTDVSPGLSRMLNLASLNGIIYQTSPS